MAQGFLDASGFETGDTAELAIPTGTISVQAGTVRNGGYALRVNPIAGAVGHASLGGRGPTGGALFASAPSVYARVYFLYATKPATAGEPILAIFSPSQTVKLEVRLTAAGVLAVYDSALSLLATGTTVLAAATWYRISVMCGTGAAADWEVRIDGVVEASGTGNLLTLNAGIVRFGKYADRNNNAVDFFYDDIAWSDSAYPGPGQITALRPAANGTYQTFTIGAGSGAHYTLVDELPPDTTEYLLSPNVVGSAETFGLSSAAGVTGAVNLVKTLFTVNKDAANALIGRRLCVAGNDFDQASPATVAGAIALGDLYVKNPYTMSAWTPASLAGIEVGLVEASAANKTRLHCVFVMVDFNTAGVPAVAGRSAARRNGRRWWLWNDRN